MALNEMLDQVGAGGYNTNTPAERRRAALTAASHAIAGGWEGDLGDVLDALGLRAEP